MEIKKAYFDDKGWPVVDGQKILLMGAHLYLDGEDVGRFHFHRNKSYSLVLYSSDGYKKFAEAIKRKEVQLSDGDIILEISAEDFERNYLQKLETVHRDTQSYFEKEVEFPFGERVPREVLESTSH